jgi:two-component system, cell cycle sensor histidine kinase and response regulator CckA
MAFPFPVPSPGRGFLQPPVPTSREVDLLTIVKNLREVVFVVDAQFRRVHYVSPAYERVWGRSCASLHADPKSFLEPVLDEDRLRLLADIAKVQASGEQVSSEYRIMRPDGTTRWILVSSSPVRDAQGRISQISGVALDITEHKQFQQALRESESRFQLLCDALADGIIISEEGFILEANGGLARMLGYELDELIGQNPIEWIAEESREVVKRRIADGMEGSYEVIARRKDGGRVVLEATARMMVEDGRVRRITALRDITEKRKLEEQFRHAQKMEAVGRLAGGVAHDFNNLLTVISSYSELLIGDMTPSDPRRLDITEIQKASATAATLTRQLLAFSRQQVAEPRCLVLEDVIASTSKLLRRLIGEDVELIPPVSHRKTLVKMDPGQLEQIIMNLAVNARDAMPAGGKLSVETGEVTLTDQYASHHWPVQPGRYAMLAVTDTGIGMTAEIRSRIFEPFFTTKEAGKGTGLGLATVYGIVKQNMGFIWVYSEPGRGSTFKIYLPLENWAVQAENKTEDNPENLKGRETILLVEDYASVRGAARQILLRQGYTVLECTDGDSALELLAKSKQPINLLLTDVVMPVMSGRELAERFRVRCPGAKTLYMSGYPDQAIVNHGILAPGVAYLQKPFSSASLSRKVREVLDT